MNNHRLPILAALLFVALAPPTAHARGWEIKLLGLGGLLRSVEGRPVFTAGGDIPQDQVWKLTPSGKTTIIVSGGKQYGSLVYPLKGDDPAVTLSTDRKKEVPRWEVIHANRGRYAIRAAEGKYKGWYLGVSAERSKEDEKKGIRRPVLEKAPKQPTLFEIFEVAN